MKKTKNKGTAAPSIYGAMSLITSAFLVLLLTFFLFYTGSGGFVDIQNSKYKAFLLLGIGYISVSLICMLEGTLVGAVKIRSVKSIFNNLSGMQKIINN